MCHIYTCYYRGNRHVIDIKSMLIKTSSFFTIFHFLIVSILVEWLTMQNIASFMDIWLHTNRSYKCNVVTKVKATLSRLLCFYYNIRQGTFLTAPYLSVKIFYLLNVVGQFLIINGFMRTKDTLYGFDYLKKFWSGEYLKENMLIL